MCTQTKKKKDDRGKPERGWILAAVWADGCYLCCQGGALNEHTAPRRSRQN